MAEYQLTLTEREITVLKGLLDPCDWKHYDWGKTNNGETLIRCIYCRAILAETPKAGVYDGHKEKCNIPIWHTIEDKLYTAIPPMSLKI